MPHSSPNIPPDLRSLPTRTMNLYLYPMAGWALLLFGLFVLDQTPWALFLCFPLAVWNAGLSITWGRFVTKQYNEGLISQVETRAGVQSVGGMLSAASMMPGIVFLIDDPLAMSSWSTFFGIMIVAAIARFGVDMMVKVPHRFASYFSLTVACLALPINTTGAASVAATVGLFDRAIEDVGAPDDWKIKPHLPDVQ